MQNFILPFFSAIFVKTGCLFSREILASSLVDNNEKICWSSAVGKEKNENPSMTQDSYLGNTGSL